MASMESKANYELDDLIDIAEEINNGNVQDETLNNINEALENIKNLSNAEIKKIYNDLKTKFYASEESKRRFHKYKKATKKMIKSDKKRSHLRHLKKGKWLSVTSLIYGYILSYRYNGIGMKTPPALEGQNTIEYIAYLIDGNLRAFMKIIPEGSAVVGACALGVVLYAGGVGLVKLDDMKTMRRLMVQAMAEDMTPEELDSVIKVIKKDGGKVKEAMNTYPLKNYADKILNRKKSNNNRNQDYEDEMNR